MCAQDQVSTHTDSKMITIQPMSEIVSIIITIIMSLKIMMILSKNINGRHHNNTGNQLGVISSLEVVTIDNISLLHLLSSIFNVECRIERVSTWNTQQVWKNMVCKLNTRKAIT
jgi:hypothetical protein